MFISGYVNNSIIRTIWFADTHYIINGRMTLSGPECISADKTLQTSRSTTTCKDKITKCSGKRKLLYRYVWLSVVCHVASNYDVHCPVCTVSVTDSNGGRPSQVSHITALDALTIIRYCIHKTVPTFINSGISLSK